MQRYRKPLAAILLGTLFVMSALVTLVGFASAAPGQSSPSNGNKYSYAIVELANAPVGTYAGGVAGYAATQPAPGHKIDFGSAAVARYEAYLGLQHANFRAWLHSNAPAAQIVREYSLVLNGFAVQLNGASLNALQRGPGVLSVTPDSLYRPSMDVSIPLIGADQVWSDLGVNPFSGSFDSATFASIKVGVIDSGIDDTHPFIASCRAEGSIVHDVFFSGTSTSGPTIVVDHGTHVSGTIGGCPTEGPFNVSGHFITLHGDFGDAMSGIAPGVTLHDYNVFPGYGAGYIAFGGSAFSHDIIAAVEKAVNDGMDVINLSLGGSVQGPHDTLAEAINAAVDAGTIAAVAAGNSGPGILTVESPGNAANAITAGASANPHYLGITVTTNAATYGAALGDFANFDPAITATTSQTTPRNGCSPISEDLTGKIALIYRGTCTFGTKISYAEDAGAVGVLVINNAPGDPVAMGGDGVHTPTIPAAMVSRADGAVLNASAPETITVDGTTLQEIITSNADYLAGFSSWGPTPYDFRVKPDVVAPGVNVLSSVFTYNATTKEYEPSYAFFQGTSMATPHVTGAVVLLLAEHPTWSPAEVKSALVNTADRPAPLVNLAPIQRGGGRINVESAADAAVTLAPAEVSFGGFTGGKPVYSSVEVTVMNQLGSSQSCAVSVIAPVSGWLSYVSLSSGTLSLPGDGSLTLTVMWTEAQAATGLYYGDVRLECDGGTFLAPWFIAIQRGNGFLNGSQSSPALALDPAMYGDLGFLVAGTWTG